VLSLLLFWQTLPLLLLLLLPLLLVWETLPLLLLLLLLLLLVVFHLSW